MSETFICGITFMIKNKTVQFFVIHDKYNLKKLTSE